MILITGRFDVDPQQREAFLAFAQTIVPRERMAQGCIHFDIFEDVTAPNRFLMLEEWESQEALDAHTSTDEFDENEAALEQFLVGDPSWDEYEF